jgi:MerR family transcriptional regulator/heat shock protein HspR
MGARSVRKKIIPSSSRNVQDQSSSRHVEGVYVISVASRILEMHPQTLRKYERLGLVNPSRTEGMLRLYSERDIARLRMIKELVEIQRMNLAGVEMALRVINRLLEISQLVHNLADVEEDARERIHREMEGTMHLLGFILPSNSQE